MSRKYAGESPSKTIARQLIWEQIIRRTGKNKTHLCLSGPDAGDLRLVCAIHEPKYIIGVERDAEAIAKAEKQLMNDYQALLVYGDIRKFAWSEKFDSIFLDWCNNINSKSITATFSIIQKHLSSDGVFGVGLCFARESRFITSRFGKRLLPDAQRVQLFSQIAEIKGYRIIWCCSYTSGHTPMIYMLFRRQKQEQISDVQILRIKATKEEIVERAKFSMRSRPSREIEDVYCLPKNTVAGWKAAETRRNKLT